MRFSEKIIHQFHTLMYPHKFETNYMHLFACHSVEKISAFGSLYPFSNDIQETLNYMLKKYFREFSFNFYLLMFSCTNRQTSSWLLQAWKRMVYPHILLLNGIGEEESYHSLDKRKMTAASLIAEENEEMTEDELLALEEDLNTLCGNQKNAKKEGNHRDIKMCAREKSTEEKIVDEPQACYTVSSKDGNPPVVVLKEDHKNQQHPFHIILVDDDLEDINICAQESRGEYKIIDDVEAAKIVQKNAREDGIVILLDNESEDDKQRILSEKEEMTKEFQHLDKVYRDIGVSIENEIGHAALSHSDSQTVRNLPKLLDPNAYISDDHLEICLKSLECDQGFYTLQFLMKGTLILEPGIYGRFVDQNYNSLDRIMSRTSAIPHTVFIPVNVQLHWFFFRYDVKTNILTVFDSLYKRSDVYKQYKEHVTNLLRMLLDPEIIEHDVAIKIARVQRKQQDNVSCAIFVYTSIKELVLEGNKELSDSLPDDVTCPIRGRLNMAKVVLHFIAQQKKR